MCKCLLVLLAFIAPPLAVLVHSGCRCVVCINLILTCCLWIPGVIHAIYIICTREMDDGSSNGHHHHRHHHH